MTDFPAIADVTLQPNNESFVVSSTWEGEQADRQDIDYTEGLYIDYRWFDQQQIDPIYEFGFGMYSE
jgi:hypothetical protein